VEHPVVLRVALSTLRLNYPVPDVTLDGDRPGRAYAHRDRGPEEIRRRPDTEADPAFTDWLGKTLHETYDPVTREPLPRELALLIGHLERLKPH
jgi:hypothetical protein